MDSKNVLKLVIEVYQNDFMCGYEGEDKNEKRIVLLELISELSRYTNNIRYCSKIGCVCSPERSIERILNKDEAWLKRNLFGPFTLATANKGNAYESLRLMIEV